MNGDLVAELDAQGRAFLAHHQGLRHEWAPVGAGTALVFPAASPDGFEVRIEADEHGLRLSAGVGYHTHLDWQATAAEAVAEALATARDLLSPVMRIVERRAGGNGYRWELQRRAGEGWAGQGVTGQLFWNWLAARSERVYQNDALPAPGGEPATN